MPQGKNDVVRRIVLLLVIIIAAVTALFLAFHVYKNKDKILKSSGLSANELSGTGEVYLDGKKLGNVPYDSKDIKPGTHSIKLIGSNGSVYETSLKFIPNWQVVINRDLGVARVFSSGQDFWVDDKDLSSVLSIVSDPPSALVFIDDAQVGKTPYSSSVLIPGEYDLRVEKEGFESQMARIKVEKDHKLNVSVKLFLAPMPSKLSLVSGSKMVYDLSSDSNDLILDVPSWVSGIIYWNKTRESNPVKFSYFLDYLGSIYTSDGKGIVDKSKISLKEGEMVGYLGRKSDNGVTAQALSSAEMLTGIDIVSVRKAKVLQTPTGWLRLRSEPNLSATEVGRVNTGDEVFIIEDKGEWKKIRTADGKEGWAYSSYLSEIKK